MIIYKRSAELQTHLQKLLPAKPSIGFVPTMGALHEGHISLLKKSKQIAGITVCSIFINPTQFNNQQDYKKYPVTIEQDIYLLEINGCDILFLPDVNEIYPGGNFQQKHFNLGYLENILEGKYRPVHFQGVCQVVMRLLQIVNPVYLFVGQKDYQQCLVLKRLLNLINSRVELIICPIRREKDGLAMSSRNLRLNEDERVQAPAIYEVLLFIQQHIKPGNLKYLKKIAENFLVKKSFKVDYIEIAYADNLRPVDEWNGTDQLVILAAAYINDIRLIDNLRYTV
ncbi:MAG: pantoate--beta-alanine ligase [Ginsengibacter sp.]